MNYKPLSDRVIIEQQAAEETTASGIVLPGTAQEKPQSGTVIAVGAGRVSDDGKAIPMTVKVGDTVIFSKYGGTELKHNDKEYLIVKENDILAIETK